MTLEDNKSVVSDASELRALTYLESLSLKELTLYIRRCNRWQNLAIGISNRKSREAREANQRIRDGKSAAAGGE